MPFKVGDLARVSPKCWVIGCPLEDINRTQLKGRDFQPEEMNGAIVEVIAPSYESNFTKHTGLIQVYYVYLNAYGAHYLKDIIPLNAQVP